MTEKPKDPPEATPAQSERKVYEPPRLTLHGTLADITQGAKAGSSDIGGLTATGL